MNRNQKPRRRVHFLQDMISRACRDAKCLKAFSFPKYAPFTLIFPCAKNDMRKPYKSILIQIYTILFLNYIAITRFPDRLTSCKIFSYVVIKIIKIILTQKRGIILYVIMYYQSRLGVRQILEETPCLAKKSNLLRNWKRVD